MRGVEVREGISGKVLHRVMYPKTHANGNQKKKKKNPLCRNSVVPPTSADLG